MASNQWVIMGCYDESECHGPALVCVLPACSNKEAAAIFNRMVNHPTNIDRLIMKDVKLAWLEPADSSSAWWNDTLD